MDPSALSGLFQQASQRATEAGLIPVCEWSPWVFKPQADRKRGDFSSQTVLSTVHRYMNTTGLKVNIDSWNEAITETVKTIEDFSDCIESITATKGHINVWCKGEHAPPDPTGFSLQPIGFMETCFWEKFGTPRQSLYAVDARGKLTLSPHINADSLDGLSDYSHVWVLFLFHEAVGSAQTKVRPPRLGGEKRGVFATRSPHRPNPIGMSVLRLLGVRGREVFLSGVDVISGTPVLDIKPYHPADSVPAAVFPSYISTPLDLLTVTFRPSALQQLTEIQQAGKLQFYSPDEPIVPILESILAQDPATVYSKTHRPTLEVSGLSFDTLDISYVRAPPILEVLEVAHNPEHGVLRTAAWLQDIEARFQVFGHREAEQGSDRLD